MAVLLIVTLSAGIAVNFLYSWSFATLLVGFLLAVVGIPALTKSIEWRLVALFSLLAVGDFLKKATFLVDDQALWSQFLVFLLAWVYFVVAILTPWIIQGGWRRLTSLHRLVFVFIAVALINTWISKDGTLVAKGAATGLLIAPWLMISVASSHPRAISSVSTVLVGFGVLSAIYGIFQFLFGPTAVELNWAEQTGRLSIGATHLLDSLEGEQTTFIWRITGFQPDAFTFALFMMTSIFSAWILRRRRKISSRQFLAASTLFAAAITLSLVRTVWIASVALVGYTLLARRFRFLLKPVTLLSIYAAAFFLGDVASFALYRFTPLAQAVTDPALRRAVTLGTLAARKGAIEAFLNTLPDRWISGIGYAASPWITNKFGGFATLPENFSSHNVMVELLWYVGLPGLVLFVAVVWRVVNHAYRGYRADVISHKSLSLLFGYLLAMYLTGLGNGGVFLSFYYFFFLGATMGIGTRRDDRAATDAGVSPAKAHSR